MSVLQDLALEIDNYDNDFVDIKFQPVQFLGTGSNWNPGETFRFQVAIWNRGVLNMKNPLVLVEGTPWATVIQGSAIQFGEIKPGGSAQSGAWVTCVCKAATNGEKEIVTARIATWDAGLDYILNERSGWSIKKTSVKATVINND